MGRLIYSAICSLDGYTADADGDFRWAAPDAEVHAFVNDLERPIGLHLYGRAMYEVMVFWEQVPDDPEPEMQDYARIWQAADKVVFSTMLEAPRTARTRLERTFDPAAVTALVAGSPTDVSIGGPTLAAHALAAGIVDELQLIVVPAIVGSGLRALPMGLRADLTLTHEQRFAGGTVFLRYAFDN